MINAGRDTASVGAPDAAPIISGMKVMGVQASGHEVSIRIEEGDGAGRGAHPRANLSMRIMRPPQHGQYRDGSIDALGAGASAIGFSATASSARARARFA